jgi:hypothetical protein
MLTRARNPRSCGQFASNRSCGLDRGYRARNAALSCRVPCSMLKRRVVRSTVTALLATALAGCELVMGDLPPKQTQELQTPDAAGWGSAGAGSLSGPIDAGVSSAQAGGAAEMRSDAAVRNDKPRDAGVDSAVVVVDAMIGPVAACDAGPGRVFYRDRDEDGFGDPAAAMNRCAAAEGWSENNKDCNDEEADVHPGQTAYFGFGYRTAANSTGSSFDYNCDGSESAAPDQELGPTICQGALLNLICGRSGFAPNAERANLPGINAYCGSNIIASCDALLCQPHQTTAEAHYTCN